MAKKQSSGSRSATVRAGGVVKNPTSPIIDFVGNGFQSLACMTALDADIGLGKVILNVVTIKGQCLPEALDAIDRAVSSVYITGERVLVFPGGSAIGDLNIPTGRVALGVLSTASIIGLLVREGVPAYASHVGLLEVDRGVPQGFVSAIGLRDISYDVLGIYINAGLVDFASILEGGRGRCIAMIVDIPESCVDNAEKYAGYNELIDIAAIGRPGESLLGIPIGKDKAGMVFYDSMNAFALMRESGLDIGDVVSLVPWEYEDLLLVYQAKEVYCGMKKESYAH